MIEQGYTGEAWFVISSDWTSKVRKCEVLKATAKQAKVEVFDLWQRERTVPRSCFYLNQGEAEIECARQNLEKYEMRFEQAEDRLEACTYNLKQAQKTMKDTLAKWETPRDE